MFALAIVLFALAFGDALFGIHGVQGTLLWIACVMASIIAMVVYWRSRDEYQHR
jgi:ABC-type transport system involved in cytochrome c biogenesis permease component